MLEYSKMVGWGDSLLSEIEVIGHLPFSTVLSDQVLCEEEILRVLKEI